MKHVTLRILALLLGLMPLCAQPAPVQAPRQEVVLSATQGSKISMAFATPKVGGLDAALVKQDFSDVVNRDLVDAGLFSILGAQSFATEPIPAFGAWRDAGAEMLLVTRLSKATGSELNVEVEAFDTKAGKRVFGKKYTGQVNALRRMAHRLVDEFVASLTGERGVADSRILFARQVSPGVKELFQVDRDGAGLIQLTRHASLTISPSVASDGRLAYITYKGGPAEIWGQRKAGGPHEKLYPLGGSKVGMCSSPCWSPNGRRIAFVQGDLRGNSDIMVLDLDTNRVRKLTGGTGINTEPCWSPSGSQLTFTSDREGTPQIYLMEEDGSNIRRLTTEGNYNASPAWSPNGAMIAYVSRFEGRFDVFVYKLGEGKAYQITRGQRSSESPIWSPDERNLAFASNRSGTMQIYITDLSGNNVAQLSDLTACQSPQWTRSR